MITIHRHLWLPALAALTLTLSACNPQSGAAVPATNAPATAGGDAAPLTDAPVEAQAAATEFPEPTEIPPTDAPPTATPGPDLSGEGPWEVTIETADGIALAGMLYGEGQRAIVLVPGYPDEQAGWAPFAEAAAEAGYLVLSFDLRGRGDSGGEVDLLAAPDDTAAAVAFLRELDATHIMLVGADRGSLAAIKVALADPDIAGIALLGPPWEAGDPADSEAMLATNRDELATLTTPSLWIGARLDLAQGAEEMAEAAGSADKTLWIYEGSSLSGTYLLEGSDGADLTQRLLDFAGQTLGS